VLDKEIDGKRVPLRFELITNSGNDVRRLTGLAIVDPLKRAGVDASFRQIDFGILLSKMKKLDFDAVILGWSMGVTPPDLYQIWHSSQAVEGGSNAVGFKNAEVDRLLEAYREEFDAEKRKQMIDRVQKIIYEEQPYTFLYMPRAVDSWSRRFRGVQWYERSKGTDMARWWVPRAEQRYSE
jgi:peptide/nickel transport system substrate-binding protein